MDNTSKWVKALFVLGAVFLIVFVAATIANQRAMEQRQALLEKSIVEMKELQDGIFRSQSKYVTKEDLEQMAEKLALNLAAIEDDLESLNAEVKGINTILASTPGYHGDDLPSTGSGGGGSGPKDPPECNPDGTCPDQDPYDYQLNSQTLALNEPFNNGLFVPFGQTTFKAWKQNPWSLDIYPRDYSITTVLGQDEEGRHYTYNRFTITANGKTTQIPLNKAEFVEELPESKWRFNPRMYLGADAGVAVNPPSAEFAPNVQVSMFSKGVTKLDSEWTAVGVGVGYETQSKRPNVNLSPIGYNVGRHLPFMKNVIIAPSVGVNTAGTVTITGGVKVGL